MDEHPSDTDLISIAADVISAYVMNNALSASDLPQALIEVHQAFSRLRVNTADSRLPDKPLEPAVPIRKSITPDFIISLEDGRRYKSLKRHLRTSHGLTPEQYRIRWGLPSDYPMVAPNYAAIRSELAKKAGLGRTAGETKPPKRQGK